LAASAETPKKARKLMLSSDPIGSNGRITVVDRTPGIPAQNAAGEGLAPPVTVKP
jgi:hypothetical protein